MIEGTKQVLTKLYDRERKIYVDKWLTKEEFENLPPKYCLPHEVKQNE